MEKTFFWYGFYVSCLNPSEYICNHLFKIYIYIYTHRFQGCVVLVDLDLVMLGLVLLVIMVFIGFFDVCRFGWIATSLATLQCWIRLGRAISSKFATRVVNSVFVPARQLGNWNNPMFGSLVLPSNATSCLLALLWGQLFVLETDMKQSSSFLPLSSTCTFICLLVLISPPPVLVSSPKSKFNLTRPLPHMIYSWRNVWKWLHHHPIHFSTVHLEGRASLNNGHHLGVLFASYSRSCTYCFCRQYTPPKTHMSPEQWCLNN